MSDETVNIIDMSRHAVVHLPHVIAPDGYCWTTSPYAGEHLLACLACAAFVADTVQHSAWHRSLVVVTKEKP